MILTNARIATMQNSQSYGLIENGALVTEGEKIKWVGGSSQIPEAYRQDTETLDCHGKLITPGLIDCHTHLVYAGDRAREFELRLEGATYEEIANSGGGIVSTVKATREAHDQTLYKQSLPRLEHLLNEGVTTVEIKSGYGLDTENEIKMLRVADKLANLNAVRVQKTFLGAHALPPEYAGKKEEYIDLVCHEMLPEAHRVGLVDAVDAFSEGIAFNVEQVERVFEVAQHLGLPIKLHAEQLSDLGGAAMAAKRGAISVDHLEYLQEKDVAVLAENQTVAVLLPGAFYVLKETKLPPVKALRQHNVALAIASDCNPGSSPVTSLLLTMNMACTLFGLTPTETLAGVTINAAKALGMGNQIGSIEPDKAADLVLWDTDNPATLSYRIGFNPCAGIMANGSWRKAPEL